MSDAQAVQQSPNTNKEFDRFKAALSAIVKVKKEDVDRAMEQDRVTKNERKGKQNAA